jgi:hypothetical protein
MVFALTHGAIFNTNVPFIVSDHESPLVCVDSIGRVIKQFDIDTGTWTIYNWVDGQESAVPVSVPVDRDVLSIIYQFMLVDSYILSISTTDAEVHTEITTTQDSDLPSSTRSDIILWMMLLVLVGTIITSIAVVSIAWYMKRSM